jgi:hypothetical protein
VVRVPTTDRLVPTPSPRDFGIPNLTGFLPKGSSVYLTAEEATRMKDYIEEEVRER